jgi:hypothetical protein
LLRDPQLPAFRLPVLKADSEWCAALQQETLVQNGPRVGASRRDHDASEIKETVSRLDAKCKVPPAPRCACPAAVASPKQSIWKLFDIPVKQNVGAAGCVPQNKGRLATCNLQDFFSCHREGQQSHI